MEANKEHTKWRTTDLIAARLLRLLLPALLSPSHRIGVLPSEPNYNLILRLTTHPHTHHQVLLAASLAVLQSQTLRAHVAEQTALPARLLHLLQPLLPLALLQLVFAQQQVGILPDGVLCSHPRITPTLVPRRLFDWKAVAMRTMPPFITNTGTRASDGWPQSGQNSFVSSWHTLHVNSA